ncbi:hypothetical protein [Streptomyces sp. H27-H5]|uniref:hypothetical protein n=1 Tax=Streptomyces sp. H27-H5 TaxID=2996460 RepID=UPI00226E3340|nr:hypothetical protein [Streptomyces sp. H27-H5]MCY0957656.1 hypothetical protein [Streptomyces sp. H27-H5]
MSSSNAVTDVARERVASSDQPARFLRLVGGLVDDITRHGLNDRATAGWTAADPVLLAGVRRLRALHHPSSCRCDACKAAVHRAVRKDSR